MGTVLVLRTCNRNMTSYGGFKWPKHGFVQCPDWNPAPICGGGLHGLLNGNGDIKLMNWKQSAKWLVVEVQTKHIVKIDNDKVKFKEGCVIYCGDKEGALSHFPLSKSYINSKSKKLFVVDRFHTSSTNQKKVILFNKSQNNSVSTNSYSMVLNYHDFSKVICLDSHSLAESINFGISIAMEFESLAKSGDNGISIIGPRSVGMTGKNGQIIGITDTNKIIAGKNILPNRFYKINKNKLVLTKDPF